MPEQFSPDELFATMLFCSIVVVPLSLMIPPPAEALFPLMVVLLIVGVPL